jgi:hypothetical protein
MTLFSKILFFLFLLINEVCTATSWVLFPYIRAGIFFNKIGKKLMINSISDYGTTFASTTITYSNSIGNSSSVFSLTLSLCNFVIYEANEISFDVNVTSIGSTVSTVKMILNQSSVVSLMTFQYLVVDRQRNEIDYKSICIILIIFSLDLYKFSKLKQLLSF